MKHSRIALATLLVATTLAGSNFALASESETTGTGTTNKPKITFDAVCIKEASLTLESALTAAHQTFLNAYQAAYEKRVADNAALTTRDFTGMTADYTFNTLKQPGNAFNQSVTNAKNALKSTESTAKQTFKTTATKTCRAKSSQVQALINAITTK